MRMAQASVQDTGYRGSSGSPIGIGGAVAVHAMLLGAFLLIPKEVYQVYIDPPLQTTNVPIDQPPPPEKDKPVQTETVTPRKADMTVIKDTVVPTQTKDSWVIDTLPGGTFDGKAGGTGDIVLPPPPPLPDPVLVEPQIDQRYAAGFQPDYPGMMIRQQQEGKVTVRVTIGPDGRVTDIVKLSATNEAFWIATQRHALRKWRFRPATRDGVAISGVKELTVHFRLEN